MKILVVGNGFIASHLKYSQITERLFPDYNQLKSILIKNSPDVIINCIGYCGQFNIDDCQNNKEKTITSNITIPTILATECYNLGIHFIHLGSGCINYGPSPNIVNWNEEDPGWKETNTPKLDKASLYSKTKYAADLAIGDLPNVAILRIRMPISQKNHPRNLINKLIKYENVLDHPNSVTFVDDLVKVIDWVVLNNKTGIYHVTNPQSLRHSQILSEYIKYRPDHKYKLINEKELEIFIKSPRSNCILNTDKLKNEGFQMSPTLPMLEETMNKYIRDLK